MKKNILFSIILIALMSIPAVLFTSCVSTPENPPPPVEAVAPAVDADSAASESGDWPAEETGSTEESAETEADATSAASESGDW